MSKLRLIELFSGIGAQASALERLGVDFDHWITSEWEVNAVASYNAIHIKDYTDYSSELSSVDSVANQLFYKQISTDGKNPMTLEQIKRKGEAWIRQTYNNFYATYNIGSITSAHGSDLVIEETDKYTYLLTYSFPCQDLSVAGNQAGMSKGSGTRSGLLWEVERLLNECEELPQVLVMENVPQVHGKKFIKDFESWLDSLSELGYKNYWKDLNSKDYGVAQNRNRTFLVSFLKDVSFKFPEPFPLTKTMADYLEDDVDEKYYIDNDKADELIKSLIAKGEIQTDRQTDRQTVDFSLKNAGKTPIANCICARYDKGVTSRAHEGSCVLEIIKDGSKEIG
jgi:DNA (cytosine-5)-methyltransferase 1